LKQFIAESMFDALARTCMSRAGTGAGTERSAI
jgi:hypothetical protein